MPFANPQYLVSTDWLADHLRAPDIRIVDATWFMPNDERDARATYEAGHIPGAVFFDIDEIADTDSTLPHMLPSPEKFSSRVRKMGLGDGNRIVVYDANGGHMAAHRVWWTFRVFGHDDVAVLDGGLPKWQAEGRSVDDIPPNPTPRHFTPRVNNTLVRTRDQVNANIASGREQVVDARSADRFSGAASEPRPAARQGHIPGSRNLPFNMLLDSGHYGTLRGPDEIRAAFENAGIDVGRPVIATCGSGVTASVLAFALHLLGNDAASVYDGSWVEWGNTDSCPVEEGC